jgi:hypothetical protein
MRFNVMALGVTVGLFWGGAILLIAAANVAWPPYGQSFLDVVASMYPGYVPGSGAGSVITGTLYGLVDGAFGGMVFGLLYNLLSSRLRKGT